MQVIKFGGTSICGVEQIKSVINIVKNKYQKNKNLIVVVSAHAGVTDTLLELSQTALKSDIKDLDALKDRHQEIINGFKIENTELDNYLSGRFAKLQDKLSSIKVLNELSKKTLDDILSNGELLSARILTEVFNAKDLQANFVDARELIFTDDTFGNARVNFEPTNKEIKNYFSKNPGLNVVTGFIAQSESKEIVTLGRGGSDYTAAIIGAALDVEEIEIWTDVDGLYSADPKRVKRAFPQKAISFSEAMELSHFGAKVIYPPSIQPAFDKQIPIRIKNTFNPEFVGTVISTQTAEKEELISGISAIDDIAFLRLEGSGMSCITGVSKRLFSALANHGIRVMLITQASSKHTICFAVKPEHADLAKEVVDQEFQLETASKLVQPTIVEKDLSIISVVGENMKEFPGVAGKTFSALGKNGINITAIAQGSSELNISAVIDKHNLTKALKALHEEFFFPDHKILHLYIVGTGLIGKALLKQIETHAKTLAEKHASEVRVIGISNSKVMKLNPEGLDVSNLLAELENDPEDATLDGLIERIKEFNLPQSVLVDCTASEHVTEKYLEVLRSNISIVTPNKKAQTADYQTYSDLKRASSRRGIKFLYETSVGAALPVIGTLNDLIKSGDQIIKIEGVLSGTLSYIFNELTKGKSFSEIVLQAKNSGFTEPDPRDDLNGLDVARKILILAREAGLELELDDVKIENLVPENCRDAKDVDQFFKLLKKSDSDFEERRKKAEAQNSKLCYIAKLENNKVSVGLESINSSHPFYDLSGGDNIISFTTNCYKERPLVVCGPGAGAEVTSAGVLADIIRLTA